MGVKLNTASGGSVSIEPTNTASNYTLTVPAQTGTVVASDSSGNVGIGTSSPSLGAGFVALKTKGSGAGGVGSIISESTDGTTWIDLYSGAGGSDTPSIIYPSSKSLRFGYGTQNTSSYTEAMRIDSSGNLLVNQTSTNGTGGKINVTFAGGSEYGIKIKSSVSNTGAMAQFNNSANSEVGTITTTNSATSYNTSSDYRLKENIAPMTGALDLVQQLKPVTYSWKIDGSSGQGFIAHELQEVVPDCVAGEKDAVNEDGSIKAQGIDTSFLVATLTAAIQELNAKVDAQAAEIALLKGQA